MSQFSENENWYVCSIVVQARPEKLNQVKEAILAISTAEIHGEKSDEGKLVVTCLLYTSIAHHSDRLESRKQWLFAAPSAGMLTIDEGAENAMLVQNKSLLPAGITAVEGCFSRGEVVKIKNTSGKVIALGMPRYNSDALELIKGKKSQEIEQILGYEYGAVALHRDDMIVL